MLLVDVQYTNARDCEAPRNAVATECPEAGKGAYSASSSSAGKGDGVHERDHGFGAIWPRYRCHRATGHWSTFSGDFSCLHQLNTVLVTLHRSERVFLALANDSLLSMNYF